MAAPHGNSYAKGRGRPLTLDVGVKHLRGAVEYVDAIIHQSIIGELLAGRPADEIRPSPSLTTLSSTLHRTAREAEQLASVLKVIKRPSGKKKKSRILGADEFEQITMQMAVALDREADEGLPQ